MRVGFPSSGGGAATLAVGGELDLGEVGHALWARKWRIILPTVIVALATFVYVNTLTPRYASDARVLIDVRENIFLRPEAEKSAPDRAVLDEQAVTSQIQLFLSRDLALEVITKLKLGERPEFDPLLKGLSPAAVMLAFLGLTKDPTKMTSQERVLQSYYQRLKVSSVDRSRVIEVSFQSSDPELAARVANAIADGYLTMQQQAKQDQARSASKWLSGEIDTLRQKVAEAEAKAADFRASANLFVGPNNIPLASQQLNELSTQLAAVRAQKADAESRAQLIRGILKSGRTIEAGDVVDSELIRRLSEQRATLLAQLAEQSATLLGGHPRIRELRAQIADLGQEIRKEAERRVRALENEAKIAGARVEALSANIDQLKRQAASSNGRDVEMRALEREAKAQRDLLESYLAKYREAAARDSISAAPADARIISRATASNVPVYPKRTQIVLIAAMLSLMLGVGWVVTRELLKPPKGGPLMQGGGIVRGPVVPAIRAGSVAAVPARAAEISGRTLEIPAALPLPVPAAVVEELARGLRDMGEVGQRVAVFGAEHNIGASFAAILLARALADSARVVLVDLALGAPNLSVISNDPEAPGIADLVAGSASITDAITKDRMSPAHLIAAGHHIDSPNKVLNASGLAVTIEALAQIYDYVVIDAGAVPEVTAERFAQFAQIGVLVVKDPTDRQASAAEQRLQAAGFADLTMLVADRG